MSVGTAVITGNRARIRIPWFIVYFCMAAVAASYLPRFHSQFAYLTKLGRLGLAVTLFLIGASLSRDMLKEVGPRPLIQGVVLWMIVGISSLLAITAGWIHL